MGEEGKRTAVVGRTSGVETVKAIVTFDRHIAAPPHPAYVDPSFTSEICPGLRAPTRVREGRTKQEVSMSSRPAIVVTIALILLALLSVSCDSTEPSDTSNTDGSGGSSQDQRPDTSSPSDFPSGSEDNASPTDQNPGTPPQDSPATFTVYIDCAPLVTYLENYIYTPEPQVLAPGEEEEPEDSIPMCDAHPGQGQGEPEFDITMLIDGQPMPEDVWYDGLPPLPPGPHIVTAQFIDAVNAVGEATNQITWDWEDPEQIDVSFVTPSAAIEIAPGDTLRFDAEFNVPMIIDPTALESVRKGIDIRDVNSLSLSLHNYLIEWDFKDGDTLSESAVVRSGTSSFEHTFNEEGSYLVNVTVIDQFFKMTGQDQILVDVVETPPEPEPLAVTAALLFQVVEDVAEAAGAEPRDDSSELIINTRLTVSSGQRMPGVDKSVEGTFYFTSTTSDPTNPVRATVMFQTYKTEEQALAALANTQGIVVSDRYATAQGYRDVNGKDLLGYIEQVTQGAGSVRFYLWFQAAGGGLLSAIHKSSGTDDRVFSVDGVWFRFRVEAMGPANPTPGAEASYQQQIWTAFTARAAELAANAESALLDRLDAAD